MVQEIKTCQNCQNQFVIEPEDFAFYAKIKVPPPTWCPDCRLRRRLVFTPGHVLYKRKCDVLNHKEDIISSYSFDKQHKIYDQKYWWSDEWDPMEYERKYDWNKSFFEQFGELTKEVPVKNLVNVNSMNCDYCEATTDSKNCYLVFGGYQAEDCLYTNTPIMSRNCVDCQTVFKCDTLYQCLDCNNSYNLSFSAYCDNCLDSAFLYDCHNCVNCFGCVNSRNKQYHIFNKSYSKEEYKNEIKKFNVGSFGSLLKIQQIFRDLNRKFPKKYAVIKKSFNATGNNVQNAKNCRWCFDIRDGAEDCKYLVVAGMGIKDSYDIFGAGLNSEILYESKNTLSSQKVNFSIRIHNSFNIYYSQECFSSSNLFACVGLRHKQYCILNKQYAKEEYEEMMPKIIEHMNSMPYVDKKGRVYKYGEFFPAELSPFSYNETVAQEYFPLSAETAVKAGYSWKEPEERNYQIDTKAEDLPDHIKDVKDDILNQIIGCQHQGKCNEQCTEAFKIIEPELQFYRKMNLPLPRLCPNCRHYQRIKQRNPLKLWHRKCQCGGAVSDNRIYKNTIEHPRHKQEHCSNEFETSYTPERQEIVYCEECYSNEVV